MSVFLATNQCAVTNDKLPAGTRSVQRYLPFVSDAVCYTVNPKRAGLSPFITCSDEFHIQSTI